MLYVIRYDCQTPVLTDCAGWTGQTYRDIVKTVSALQSLLTDDDSLGISSFSNKCFLEMFRIQIFFWEEDVSLLWSPCVYCPLVLYFLREAIKLEKYKMNGNIPSITWSLHPHSNENNDKFLKILFAFLDELDYLYHHFNDKWKRH